MNRNAFCVFGAILFLIITLAACQSKLFTAKGKMVVEEKRIAIQQNGSVSGSWQGKSDLTIDYTANRSQDELQMAGDILFRKHEKLNSFRLSLVLIDAGGNILDVVPIATAGGRHQIEQLPFTHELTLPPDARYFAFTYDGTSSGVGAGGSPSSFWSAPW